MTHTNDPLLDGLNPQQHQAVTAGDGPVLVLAGPGSGKTGVLTRRVAYLIDRMRVAPYNIMAVTFTNKAAGEMRSRISGYIDERVRGLQIGTFHATCARILRIEHESIPYNQDYTIYDSDDQLSAVKQAMGELNIDTKKFTPRRVLNAISSAKNEVILPQNFVAQDYFSEIVARVYPRYQTILSDSNAMDFDDLLLQMVLLLRNNEAVREKYQERYHYVLVDEFQDTNTVQYQLVQLFGAPQNNVFVVGDEDQSIYAFRGADYRNVMRFRDDYQTAQVILLEQNYRSTQIVLDVARAVIDRNSNRTRKQLFTDRDGGQLISISEAYDDEAEARYIMEAIDNLRREGYDFDDMAIMYRTNAQSRAIEAACRDYGVPYTLVGGVGFYQRREIRDILAYLRVVNNPDDSISLGRIINTPKRGIGKKTFGDFQYWARDIGYATALQSLRDGDETPLSSRASKLLTQFAEQLAAWRDLNVTGNLVNLLDRIQSDVGFTVYLNSISDRPDQFEERQQNMQELRGLLLKYDADDIPLPDFLQDQQLMTDVDLVDDDASDKVTLLTLHAAKGLEFPVVFITGLEDGLLPHQRAFEEPEGLEEERRLFYVGITRAEDRLYISYAFRRALYGGYGQQQERSGFLNDIPVDLVDPDSLAGSTHNAGQQSYREMTSWDRQRSSGLDRLKRDLRGQGKSASGHVSDESMRKKIIPFPGSEDDTHNQPLQYKTMMRVRHPVFGVGNVVESKRVDGKEIVTVAFADKRHGIKSMDAEFAKMEIL